MAKFDAYFNIQRNVIYEHVQFNRRNQHSRVTAEQYTMALCTLSEHCDYGTTMEEMIRDYIVICTWDTALSEKLQLDLPCTNPRISKESDSPERQCMSSSKRSKTVAK